MFAEPEVEISEVHVVTTVEQARESLLRLQERLRAVGVYEAVEREFDRVRLDVTAVLERDAEEHTSA